jgi:hypothetical protein
MNFAIQTAQSGVAQLFEFPGNDGLEAKSGRGDQFKAWHGLIMGAGGAGIRNTANTSSAAALIPTMAELFRTRQRLKLSSNRVSREHPASIHAVQR